MDQPEIMTELERAASYQTHWNIGRALAREHRGDTITLKTYCTLLSAALFINDGPGPFDTMFEKNLDREGLNFHIQLHVEDLLYLLDKAHPNILETQGWPSWREVPELAIDTVIRVYNAVETFLEIKRPYLQAQGFL
jgi:hypothetical protein